MWRSYRPITRSGITAAYSLAALGTNVMPTSARLPGSSTHGVLATCTGRRHHTRLRASG